MDMIKNDKFSENPKEVVYIQTIRLRIVQRYFFLIHKWMYVKKNTHKDCDVYLKIII